MLDQFRTLQLEGRAEITIKKSRFLGHAVPIASEEEALRYIDGIRKEHWNAAHHCYAYVIGDRDQYQKQSDDGEPSGTAGKPILEVILRRELKNTVVVVTRYFGGILLGAGGLIRAYTDGASAAIEAAGVIRRVLHREVKATVDYTWLGKLENELRNRNVRMGETSFTDKVTLHCLPLAAEAESFAAWLTDLTQGQADICMGEDMFMTHI